MTPLQYLLPSAAITDALSYGVHWLQTTDAPSAADVSACHAAACYLLVTDDIEACLTAGADGIVLTPAAIQHIAAETPEPSGIVLQRPLPITTAIHSVRNRLGPESPLMLGVLVTTEAEAVAAAKAGADFLQVAPDDTSATDTSADDTAPATPLALLQAVRARSFTTPVVALSVTTPAAVPALLDAGFSGIAATSDAVPPVAIPALLAADEA